MCGHSPWQNSVTGATLAQPAGRPYSFTASRRAAICSSAGQFSDRLCRLPKRARLSEGRLFVKVSPAFGYGKVCATGAVTYLMKTTSALSRGLDFGADTLTVPRRGHVQTSTYQRATGNRFHCSSRWNGSTALARETRAELRISTFTPRQRPHEPRIPHELISHQQVNYAQGRSHGSALLSSVARCPAKILRPLGMRATAVPKKETFLDEMENGTGSASR